MTRLAWSERTLQERHVLDDSGLCGCGLSPCPVRAVAEATQVIVGLNAATTRHVASRGPGGPPD